jgi:hypothetical protein
MALAFSSNGKHLYLSWPRRARTRNLGIARRTASGSFRLPNEVLHPVVHSDPSLRCTTAGRSAPNNPRPPHRASVKPDPDNPGEDLIYAALTLSDAAGAQQRFKRVNRVFDLHTNLLIRPCRQSIPLRHGAFARRQDTLRQSLQRLGCVGGRSRNWQSVASSVGCSRRALRRPAVIPVIWPCTWQGRRSSWR